jgi:hypothetical protein
MRAAMAAVPGENRRRQCVDFALFLLVTAVLFIRPTDFVPGLEAVPLFQIAIVPCILLSWHKIVPQLTEAGLRGRPVFVYGVGVLLLTIPLGFLRGNPARAFEFAVEHMKVLIYYLLLLAQVDSPARLKRYLGCLVGIIAFPILLAVLDYHGYVNIPAFQAIEEGTGDAEAGPATVTRRLVATGNFADPNDVCEIVNCALILSLYGLLDRVGGLPRILWLAPLALFGHALALTHSRGGFLGAVVGLLVLLRSRFRGTKSLVLAGAVLGLMFVFFGGRQTSFDTSSGTSQQRIQTWYNSLQVLLGSGLVGIGYGRFLEYGRHVAHNAFIHVYVELGFLGGTLLFGQYYYCLKNLRELGMERVTVPDPQLRRLQPFILATLASYAASEMSLTNPFSPVNYTIFGLATALLRLADPSPPLADSVLSWRLVRRTLVFSGLFLTSLYVFTRLTIQY